MPRILVSTITAVLLVYLIGFTTAGNTTCAGNLTQWYTDAVGETACMTYQRLRQICNQNYQVPNFRANAPGDQCDGQLQSCCCNSVSWSLSMLCMNCQWDITGGSISGIDAVVGAYNTYRSPSGTFCIPGTNQSLPTDIQLAACNEGIILHDILYNPFWSDGSWFYAYTMNTGINEVAANNNITHCNSTISRTSSLSGLSGHITSTTSSSSGHSTSTSTTSAPSQTTTAAASGSAPSSKVPIIVGAAVGGVFVLVAAAVARFCWRKRQRRRLTHVSLDADSVHAPEMSIISPYTVSDSTSGNQSPHGFERARKRGHLPVRSNYSSSSSPFTSAPLAATINESGQSSLGFLGDANSSIGALRHQDAGAVPDLARSGSGRLPPAYNPIWEPPQSETSHISDRVPNVRSSKR